MRGQKTNVIPAPFDAFHAATAETHGHAILGSDDAYSAVDAEHHALEPDDS